MTTMVCNKCGWAAFGISMKDAERQTREFGEFIAKQTDEHKASYGFGPLARDGGQEWSFDEHFSHYEHCFNCGNIYYNFHKETEDDKIPMGVTLQGIISEM